MTHRFRRPGFSLLEVTVALAVSGMVLLGVRALVEGLADNARRLHAAADRLDDQANGELTLRSLAARLEVATDSAAQFFGDEREARFRSWCEAGGGWVEHCDVAIRLVRQADQSDLSLDTSTGASITLRTGIRAGRLMYLISAANGGEWQRGWGPGVTAPLAIGIVTDRDTLVVRIGERG